MFCECCGRIMEVVLGRRDVRHDECKRDGLRRRCGGCGLGCKEDYEWMVGGSVGTLEEYRSLDGSGWFDKSKSYISILGVIFWNATSQTETGVLGGFTLPSTS